jgi:hypothetical protein
MNSLLIFNLQLLRYTWVVFIQQCSLILTNINKMICNWMAAAVGLLIPATIGLSILLSERNVHVETILDSGGSRALSSLSLYRDPATVVNKIGHYDNSMTEQQIQRANCQIVYILGVEVRYYLQVHHQYYCH